MSWVEKMEGISLNTLVKSCVLCELVDILKPEELTVGDIVILVKHLKIHHGWISEREFEQRV